MARNRVVSVRDYGAKGDARTDDTAAFQAACEERDLEQGEVSTMDTEKTTETEEVTQTVEPAKIVVEPEKTTTETTTTTEDE